MTLQAEVSQGGGSVERVKFYRDGSLVNTDTASPYSYEDTPPAVGIYSYYARAEFSDQSHSDSMTISVVVEEFLTWDNIDNNEYLEQVLATLEKPVLTRGIARVVTNGLELFITDESNEFLDFFASGIITDLIPIYEIDDLLLASLRFDYQEGFTYRAQYKLAGDNV